MASAEAVAIGCRCESTGHLATTMDRSRYGSATASIRSYRARLGRKLIALRAQDYNRQPVGVEELARDRATSSSVIASISASISSSVR